MAKILVNTAKRKEVLGILNSLEKPISTKRMASKMGRSTAYTTQLLGIMAVEERTVSRIVQTKGRNGGTTYLWKISKKGRSWHKFFSKKYVDSTVHDAESLRYYDSDVLGKHSHQHVNL